MATKLTVNDHLKQQVKLDVGGDESLPKEHYLQLLQKYGVMAPRLTHAERNIVNRDNNYRPYQGNRSRNGR